MTYGKLLSAEPETGRILQLHLDNEDVVRMWGTKKQLRKAVAGGNYEGVQVCYNRSLPMLEEDWLKIQSVLRDIDFGPQLNQHMQMSYKELEKIPQRGWRAGLNSYGGYRGTLFTYHSVNLFRKRSDPKAPDFGNLYGLLRELDFPEDGQMTIWRFWDFNLTTMEYRLEKEEPRPNEYFYA